MTRSKLFHLTDNQILKMRVCDLPLDDSSTPFPHLIKQLNRELKRKGVEWTPHLWASEEWFSPDGVPGFAFPFTLLDPRLVKLEKEFVGFYEGSTEREFIKLLRHECAHAIDNAFHLRKNKKRQKLFGKSSLPYPSYYIPRPYSKSFVRHLPGNYAQAHPEEDWAETFAVWLGPKTAWKRKYAGWKALDKLELVDEIVASVSHSQPKVTRRDTPLHFREDTRTVAQYLRWRKKNLGLRRNNFYKNKMDGLFSVPGNASLASDFIRAHERDLCQGVARRTSLKNYVVKNMLKEFKLECKARNYRIKYSGKSTKTQIEELLARHSHEYVRKKRHRIFM